MALMVTSRPALWSTTAAAAPKVTVLPVTLKSRPAVTSFARVTPAAELTITSADAPVAARLPFTRIEGAALAPLVIVAVFVPTAVVAVASVTVPSVFDAMSVALASTLSSAAVRFAFSPPAIKTD